MSTILIVSAQFRVAHISHLIASYKQLNELGYESCLYIHPDFIPYLPKNVRYITNLSQIDSVSVALFWFPAKANISLMQQLKRRFGSKIIYILHEPLESYRSYRNSGMSIWEIMSVYLKYTVSLGFIKMADFVILPSRKALNLYQDSIAVHINGNFCQLPLLFYDESQGLTPKERKYFSYIGTIAQDHAYNEFVDFILSLSKDEEFPENIRFMIATRNDVIRTDALSKLEEEGRLKIIDGHPLSDEEINACYAESIGVWNAYHRTTQSGVLAKASMFGTPALVKHDNLSEFSIDGYNVVSCDDNKDYHQLKNALTKLIQNFEYLSANARKMFEDIFSYKVHNSEISEIIRSISK